MSVCGCCSRGQFVFVSRSFSTVLGNREALEKCCCLPFDVFEAAAAVESVLMVQL